mmetsp:Transcript_113548/g.331780  ORF Transcript_113548/g.331780 Transcript_113548/m.331780 type:complete len:278 (-) Transcript_113548:1246-2079(-)
MQTAMVLCPVLERVEGHVVTGALRPILEAAVRLCEEVEMVDLQDPEREHALLEVDVLLGRLVAEVDALGVDLDGPPRQHLQGSVKAVAAVVQERAITNLRNHLVSPPQELLEPLRDEDGVGIRLHGPVVLAEEAVSHHALPDFSEDGGVEHRVELAPVLAVQVDAEVPGLEASPQVHDGAAVDRRLVAAEDALADVELAPQQVRLVAPWQHEREAEEREPRQSGGGRVRRHLRRHAADDDHDLRRGRHGRGGRNCAGRKLLTARRVAPAAVRAVLGQ